MKSIGISQNFPFVYEGDGLYGYGIWPAPILSEATFLTHDEDRRRIPEATDLYGAELIFREDSFDPVTKVRRGRLYQNPGNQPQSWRVQPHPAFSNGEEVGVHRDVQGWLHKQVHGFIAWRRDSLAEPTKGNTLLALGVKNAHTLWRVIAIERTAAGEEFLTLVARNTLGIIPEVNKASIPEDARGKFFESIQKLLEAAFRVGPESVVDRARDVAQWTIGVWLSCELGEWKWRTEDLGALCKKIESLKQEKYAVIRAAGSAIARLHSRVKPHERERRGSRPVVEEDASFALAAIGILIREVGWAA